MDINALEKSYWDEGFVIVENFFSAHEVNLLRQDFDTILNQAKAFQATTLHKNARFVLDNDHSWDSPKVRRVNWCLDLGKSLPRLTSKKELKFIISKLLGSNYFEQIICQTHYKNPKDGVKYAWHQDTQEDKGGWKDVNGRGSFVLAMIAVDDSTSHNGPVKVIPKSHLYGRLNIESEKTETDNPSKVEPLIQKHGVNAIEMSAGSIAFIGPYTVHSSEDNRSQDARRMLMSGYSTPGAKSWGNSDIKSFRNLCL